MTKFESMAQEVQADLAKESKREAKGVDWDRYQAVCDELEGADAMIEELKAKVAELQQQVLTNMMFDKIRGTL